MFVVGVKEATAELSSVAYFIVVLLTSVLVVVYLQSDNRNKRLADNKEEGSQKQHSSSESAMNTQRKSWFGAFIGQSTRGSVIMVDDAKEQAARLTREADIRRLYEAGTQREVLEQLYKPEEVHKCIQKFEQEKDLLKLVEEEQLAEETLKKAAASNAGEDNGQGESSSQGASADENEGGLGQDSSEGEEAADARRKSAKFTLRFDSSKDRAMDVSLNEVDEGNLLEIGMDSIHINEDNTKNNKGGTGRETNNLLGPLDNSDNDEPEPEDDLLKELLNTDLDESSQYEDDSVTTHDDDFQNSSSQAQQTGGEDNKLKTDGGATAEQTKDESVGNEAPLVSIDTSVMGEQSGITIGSYGSNGSSRELHQRSDSKEKTGSLSEEDESSAASNQETSTERQEAVNKEAEGQTEELIINPPAETSRDNDEEETAKSDSQALGDDDESDVEKDDEVEIGMDTEEVRTAGSNESPMATTELDVAEDNMDAASEVEVIASDNDEGGDKMDDREQNQMETTSVEDDDELSEESPKEDKRGGEDDEMDHDTRPLSPVAMDAGKLSD